MNVPAPVNPSPVSDTRTARTTATAAVAGGTPLSIVTVLLWETYMRHPLTPVEACALGSVGAGAFAYLWHVFTALIDRHLDL